MPTLLLVNIEGLRVFIPSNDHRPAHVHVASKDRERLAVFFLNCPGGPVELREQRGFRLRELNDIAAALELYVEGLCQEWERIHGGL